MKFYVGLFRPFQAQHFDRACMSVNVLRTRQKPLGCPDVLVDSGAFTELLLNGRYRHEVKDYAALLRRLHSCGAVEITAAVAQDYMCEPFILKRTGMTVEDHQRLTIERYDALRRCRLPFPIMPVLQGYTPEEYRRHVAAYGDRLAEGMWVGVGSVCKRNGSPESIIAVLTAIREERPDLRLHGFGVKTTSLLHPGICDALYSSDSMAWSLSARKKGRNGNDWQEAKIFEERIVGIAGRPASEWQTVMPF